MAVYKKPHTCETSFSKIFWTPRFPRFLMVLGTEGKPCITEGKPKGLTASLNNLVKRHRFSLVNEPLLSTASGSFSFPQIQFAPGGPNVSKMTHPRNRRGTEGKPKEILSLRQFLTEGPFRMFFGGSGLEGFWDRSGMNFMRTFLGQFQQSLFRNL